MKKQPKHIRHNALMTEIEKIERLDQHAIVRMTLSLLNMHKLKILVAMRDEGYPSASSFVSHLIREYRPKGDAERIHAQGVQIPEPEGQHRKLGFEKTIKPFLGGIACLGVSVIALGV